MGGHAEMNGVEGIGIVGIHPECNGVAHRGLIRCNRPGAFKKRIFDHKAIENRRLVGPNGPFDDDDGFHCFGAVVIEHRDRYRIECF